MNFVSNLRIEEFNHILSSFPKFLKKERVKSKIFFKNYEVILLCVIFVAFIMCFVFVSKKAK